MAYNTNNMAAVFINGDRVANLLSVENSLEREWPVIGDKTTLTDKRATATVQRIFYLGQGLPDKVSFFGLNDFILEIRYPWCTLTFLGCQWIEHKEKLTDENTIIETMQVVSKTCNVVTIM